MKISVNWVRQLVDFELPPVDEIVERIGSQLGGVDEVIDLGAKYQGVLVAKIVSCVPHPDSDHMHVCKIDDGGKAADAERDENGYVQVVCGASNVREGLTVAWLPPGSTVPESHGGKDPFVLGSRNLRGVMSNGMLASPRELALGDSHEGILEIDTEVAPGSDFAPVCGLDDYIIDIENKMFTHRPDCFGVLGVAREIAGISGLTFTSPDWYLRRLDEKFGASETCSLPVKVINEMPELVPRFVAISLSGVAVAPSPFWLQTYLLRCGVRPINNVVDITNYIMLLTAQPMHAYDYDKLVALDGNANHATLTVRGPHSDETITLLNGKTIKPRDEAIMIASNSQLLGVGGIMGGQETEVDSETKNIVLEIATFDMYSVRRTSMAHGLFTDAVTRFNKGQSPLQNDIIAMKAVEMLHEFANANIEGIVDDNRLEGRQWVHPPVPVSAEFINTRLGFNLSAEEMASLLRNVEFTVGVEEDILAVTAPFWRTDIETREDVIEEVGRLYGFDKLPLELPQRSIMPATKNPMLELKAQVRETICRAGANEVLTYSFVHGDLMRKVGQDPEAAFKLSNALSPDLQYYRLSLTPSLLDKVHQNIKAGYHEFALFELGKAHNLQHADTDEGLPAEFDMLELVYARSEKSKKIGSAYYEARNFLRRLANQFGIELEYRAFETEEDSQDIKPYDHTRAAKVFVKGTELSLGMIGEYKTSVRKALKLSKYSAGFGISLTQLAEATKEHETLPWYAPISRFPWVHQDITFKVTASQLHQPFHFFLREQVEAGKPDRSRAWIGSTDIYQSPEDPAYKQVTFRLSIASYERTLSDKEISALFDVVATAAKDKFGAERI